MSTSAQSSAHRIAARNGAVFLVGLWLCICAGIGESNASSCNDKANSDYEDCRDRAVDQERSRKPPGAPVSLRFKLKIALCVQSLENDLKECGDDGKPAADPPKAAKREPLLVMCDDKDDGFCHVVFKNSIGVPQCGRLSKSAAAGMDYKIDLNSPELAVGRLDLCPEEVLLEHGWDPRPHRGPDIKEARSKLDFDCIDDDPTARWLEGRCYSVVREERGGIKCASVAKSRIRRRDDGSLTAHRWDIVTVALDECPRKIWVRYHEREKECANPYAPCPYVERVLWATPRVTVPARPVPVRVTPGPPPRSPPPAAAEKGAPKSKSDITGYEVDKAKRERGPGAKTVDEILFKPTKPEEKPPTEPKRVGGVKVDVQSKGKEEDLSAERDEILKMRKRQ